jgi:hypothetical protein
VKRRRLVFAALLTSAFGLVAVGCGKNPASITTAAAPAARHEHKAPHGGTPVALGNEAYHLELVRDAATGTLQAYVLDGEMDNFIRCAATSFDIIATVNGAAQTLVFKPVANSVTGETVGDTAQFAAQADWLKATGNFDATLQSLAIRGTTFAGVKFNFPKGNDKD